MLTKYLPALAGLLMAAPAFAAGDAAVGAKEFNKCKACHSIVADDGTAVVKGGKVGPNLYGVFGRKAGSYPDFKYSKSMVAAGEKGLVWDEEHFVVYVQGATEFLQDYLGDPKAKGAMTYKLKKNMEDVAAYLISVGPEGAATN